MATLKSTAGLLALVATILATVSAQYSPAATCDHTACILPNCLCPTTTIPGGLTIDQVPQIVMLSFDDALTKLLYDQYYSPLFPLTNPNGCNIGITYFLSHDYTDYSLVHDVWQRGQEIASHSITHQTPVDYWKNLTKQGWVDQMYGLKEIASNLANIDTTTIIGARAPFLQIGGDAMFQALYENGFKYDCSEPTLAHTDPPIFPYSLDYKSGLDCQITPCQTDAYPGFWEVPLVDFNDTSGVPCAMLDTCPSPANATDTYDFLMYNFQKHYTSNKAPFGLFTHASWFETVPDHYTGYVNFLNEINTYSDVYIVTVSQAIDWVQMPTALSDISSFAPWMCDSLPVSDCSAVSCYYANTTAGGERYMESCVACPPNYPWLGDPYGNNTSAFH